MYVMAPFLFLVVASLPFLCAPQALAPRGPQRRRRVYDLELAPGPMAAVDAEVPTLLLVSALLVFSLSRTEEPRSDTRVGWLSH